VAAIDRFRIVALLKLLRTSGLSETRRAAIARALTEKAHIYAVGLSRRGHLNAANLMGEVIESASAWIEQADPRLTEIVELIRKMIKNPSASGTSLQAQ